MRGGGEGGRNRAIDPGMIRSSLMNAKGVAFIRVVLREVEAINGRCGWIDPSARVYL